MATGPSIITVDKTYLQQMTLRCRRILMDKPQYKMTVKEFAQQYSLYYLKQCNLDELKKDLSNAVRVRMNSKIFVNKLIYPIEIIIDTIYLQLTVINGEQFIELTPLHYFACDLYCVMINCGGTLNLSQFDIAYSTIIGSPCKPSQYGFPTLTALLQALPCTVTIKDTRKKKKIICLNKNLSGK